MEGMARCGDTIETDVTNPRPTTIRVHLLTPEACAAANTLLGDKGSGWRLCARVALVSASGTVS